MIAEEIGINRALMDREPVILDYSDATIGMECTVQSPP